MDYVEKAKPLCLKVDFYRNTGHVRCRMVMVCCKQGTKQGEEKAEVRRGPLEWAHLPLALASLDLQPRPVERL